VARGWQGTRSCLWNIFLSPLL